MVRVLSSALLLSVFGLGLGAAPAAAADACLNMTFQCNGFEPNWQFTTSVDNEGDAVLRFIDPENPNWDTEALVVESCLLQGSPNDFEVTTPAPLELIASIVGQSCTEPNDDVTDFSVTVTFMQGALSDSPRQVNGTGCCSLLDQ